MAIEQLHSISKSWVSKLILGVIAVSFVISGVAGYMFGSQDTSAVKVNGEEISQNTFQQSYEREYQQQGRLLGEQFNEVADTPEFTQAVRDKALNDLINQELLRQYVQTLNLDVGDEQIKRAIVMMPSLQNNGKFDNALYQELLKSNNLSAETFAGYMRQDLQQQQLQAGIIGSDFIVPAQFDQLAHAFFQVRSARLAPLPLVPEIAKQTVSQEEVKAYYEAHKNAFALPETVKVQYIDLTPSILSHKVNVTDVEIAQYYQDNKAQFSQQKLAHIQLGDEQAANQAYEELQKGADFAEVAQSRSQDKLSAANGGDLSNLPTAALPPAFLTQADSLAVGQYSLPIKVDNSYHIIKVLARSEKPLEQVKGEIADKLRSELVAKAFFALAKQVDEKAYEDQSGLEQAAQIAGVKVLDTDYFSRDDVPQALNYPKVVSSIFSESLINGGANSAAINVTDEHVIFVRVAEHKTASTKSLEDTAADIENLLKRQKAQAEVLNKAVAAANTLNADGQAKVEGVSFGEMQQFGYDNVTDPVLSRAIFSIAQPQEGKSTFMAVQDEKGEIAVAMLEKVDHPKVDDQVLSALRQQLEFAQQNDGVQLLLQSLRQRAKIEINDNFINQMQ